MKKAHVQISYLHFANAEELSTPRADLLRQATIALDKAYAPYSRFHVGVALRLRNGEVFSAANTENAAYPMCLCAERAALAAAAATYPQEPVMSMAITVRGVDWEITEPAAPCGSCRQVLSEHEDRYGHQLELILRGTTGPILVFDSARDLLPFGFGGSFLN